MNVNMKKNRMLLLLFFLSFITFVSVRAENQGTIRGNYSYDSHPFANQAIYLYRIADIKDLESNDKFVYLEPYNNFASNINALKSSEWQNYANELKSYIEDNGVAFDTQIITDMDGNYEFSNLSNGLYLILVDDILDNGATYTSLPMLISVPNYNEADKKYLYDIVVKAKIEEIKPEPTEPPTEPIPDVPQTSDNIMIYVIIFLLAIIALIGIGYYINKTKKEIDNHETNKD